MINPEYKRERNCCFCIPLWLGIIFIFSYSDERHSINCSDSILVIPIINVTNIVNSVVIIMAWQYASGLQCGRSGRKRSPG